MKLEEPMLTGDREYHCSCKCTIGGDTEHEKLLIMKPIISVRMVLSMISRPRGGGLCPIPCRLH